MTLQSTSVLKKLLILFLTFGGLYYAKEFLMPIVIGGILVTLFLPFCRWMERRKIPRGVAVFLCLVTLITIIAVLVTLFGWKIAELVTDVEMIKEKSIETYTNVQQYIFNHLGISVARQSEIIASEQPSFMSIMQITVGSLSYILSNLIFVFIYFIFLLYTRTHLRNFFIKLVPAAQKPEMGEMLDTSTRVSQQYLLGLAKMIFCLWVMYSIGFSIVGAKNAIFFAILCGVLEIVPFVGNITGTTLTVLVSALHGANASTIIGILIVYGTVQLIQGWVLEPLILGSQVKINPLFTIMALVLGDLVWGIPGIILAIPVTAIFKIVCDYIEPLKPYGFLIGEIVEKKPRKGRTKNPLSDLLPDTKPS